MGKPEKDAIIEEIALESLDCMEKVATKAQQDVDARQSGDITNVANSHDWNNPLASINLRNIRDINLRSLRVLCGRPIIGRVEFIDENDAINTLFITPVEAVKVPGFKFISYSSDLPLASIGTLSAGEGKTYFFQGSEQHLEVVSSTKFNPEKPKELWDSVNSRIDIDGFNHFTIESLRALLDDPTKYDEKVIEGAHRTTVKEMSLDGPPMLNVPQDKIFRLPMSMQIFLSGPPGTGKTTTLIKRIGKKTDRNVLEKLKEELALAEQIEEETQLPHETSWLVFSPTELLRQYVKEMFAKEGLVASNDHMRTWDEFRREIARDRLGLLRNSSGRGAFIRRQNGNYIKQEASDDIGWYEKFHSYLHDSNLQDLTSDAEWLADRSATDLSNIGDRLVDEFKAVIPKEIFFSHSARLIEKQIDDIQEAIQRRSESVNSILTQSGNILIRDDRDFVDKLRNEVSRLRTIHAQQKVVDDETDIDQDDEEEEEDQTPEPPVGQLVPESYAMKQLEAAWKILARARAARRSIPKKSRHSDLLTWLGEARIPSREKISDLGSMLTEQARLRRFTRPEQKFLRGVATKYKQFRREMTKERRWYDAEPDKPNDILDQELDLVILASLRTANDLLKNYRGSGNAGLPTAGALGNVRYMQRAQVLVDEATDFSPTQLACMYEIAHPLMNSFFLCGDINQRLTPHGLKSFDDLNWVSSKIRREPISVSYRQTRLLVDLAKHAATISGSKLEDIELPPHLDVYGVPPVWESNLKGTSKVAKWLARRIIEVDQQTDGKSTIAVLLNDEESIEQLAAELSENLEEINLPAVACLRGKVIGNNREVRIFDISHIKGLEFEAVFFVDLDQTITKHSDLFPKYLYVGATRAAKYLGITFSGEIPDLVEPLAKHFGADWSKP